MDDNLADYRRFCANRLKRLERCKKTKSFCNLDDEVIPQQFANSEQKSELLTFPEHATSIMFSRCTENPIHSSMKSGTVPICSGTNTFFSRSKTSPATDIPLSGSTGVFSINVQSCTAETNSAKSSPMIGSWLENSRKCATSLNFAQTDNGYDINHHSSLSSCSSPYSSSLTTPLSTLSSHSSTLSSKKPELMVIRTRMTPVNNDNHCNDSNTNGQRNFEILREKMISLMENDVRLLQQLLALGDSIQELKSQTRNCRQPSLNSLEEENANDEEWYSTDTVKTTTLGDSISTITNLYVDDEPKENENKQYFSRKNSVLRIPIPPRSSNRMAPNEKSHRRLPRLSPRCEQVKQQQQQDELVVGNNFMSRRDRSSVTVSTCPSSHPKPFRLRVPSTTVAKKQTFGTTDSRISSGSIDSGIRDESCSNSSADSLSPFLKDEKS